MALLLASCSWRSEDPSKVLNIYNWSDYIAEDTVANFERETGIRVHYDTFDTNETLQAKLLVGNSGYDVVVPSATWARLQIRAGLLAPLDKSKIPNLRNLDPALMHKLEASDPGNLHIVPWLWGLTTLGINKPRLKAALGDLPYPADPWDLLFKPEYAARAQRCGLSVMDSADEVFPVVLHYLHRPAQTGARKDYEDAAAVLNGIRPFVTTFSASGYINEMAAGSLCLVLGWNGDMNIARRRAAESGQPEDIEILVPDSGATLFFDTMAIPVDAPHKDNAYRWMNYVLRPEVSASIVNRVRYANAVPAALPQIDPVIRADREIFLDPQQIARLEAPDLDQTPEIRRLRTRLFTRFKTGD